MIKLGFLSVILGELSFEEVIEFAAENGLACVEIPCWPAGKAERKYAGVSHIDVAGLTVKRAAEINKVLRKKNVIISGLGYYPNPLDPDESKSQFYIDHLKKVITAAAMLGVPVVNTFIGRDQSKNTEDNFAKFKDVWPGIVRFAQRDKVKIAIENCPMYFTSDEWPGGKNLANTPAMWRRMFEAIPAKNFGLNFDPSHFVWQFMDPVKAIHEFKGRIFHVHLKDARILRDKLDDVGILATPLQFHTPKLPGLGDVNWGGFFSALTDAGYGGCAVIEVEDRAFEGSLDTRKASVLQSRNFLRQFIAG
jgi:sugar phosphate isomerase/epimerase